MTMSHIPVIDFKEYGLVHRSAEKARLNTKAFCGIAKELLGAFQTEGFAYLKNTGIPPEQLNDVIKAGDDFFSLPIDVKRRYTRTPNTNNGWVALEKERTNQARPGDLKECYNIMPSKAKLWPNDVVPSFEARVLGFYESCTELALRVLDVMSYGLGLESIEYLRLRHHISNGRTSSTLRLLQYPSLANSVAKPGQVHLGEHTDYGSITLLFQDHVGGLEVRCRDGIYRPATPIPDTVLVNIGDLMQRWTSDVLLSNSHRVVIPEEEIRKRMVRRSVAFFVHPDDDCIIECLDGANKYHPVAALEYLQSKFKSSY